METYADILFPLALENLLTYKIPGEFVREVFPGKQVQAPVGQKATRASYGMYTKTNLYPVVRKHIKKSPGWKNRCLQFLNKL